MTSSVRQIAERYGVSQHTVGIWIRLGDLPAVDVSRVPGARPRWRISDAGVEAFESRRAAQGLRPQSAKRRRKDSSTTVEFY